MVYAGKVGDQRFHLGVSGRLQDDNLVMWDEQTQSLWSQIRGVALFGPSEGVQLEMLPAVFVGLGTWRRLHPDTQVLDMQPVRAEGWFYKTTDLARGTVETRSRQLGKQTRTLGIGLRHADDRAIVTLPRLHAHGVVELEIGAIPVAVVWIGSESTAMVYDRRTDTATAKLRLDGEVLIDANDARKWAALTGEAEAGGANLARWPYVPSYVDAWQRHYQDSRVLAD